MENNLFESNSHEESNNLANVLETSDVLPDITSGNTSDPHLSAYIFTVPKSGNKPEENEDAAGVHNNYIALSDGASNASFESKLWADILVETFVHLPPRDMSTLLEQWLVAPIKQWKEKVTGASLPWYVQGKALCGAYATLLGLFFEWKQEANKSESDISIGKWYAVALGDSCLFYIHKDSLVLSYPIEKSADFGNTPPLISTFATDNQFVLNKLEKACYLGDFFLLVTDALAEWLLKEIENNQDSWQDLTKLTKETDFIYLVENLRKKNLIKNDDTTLIIIQV